LLDNRLKIYNGILASLSNVAHKNTVEDADIVGFLQSTKGVKYLFGTGVNDYCDRIYDTYRRILRCESQLLSSEAKTNPQYLGSQQEEKAKLMGAILEYFREFDKIFLEYFNFQNDKMPD